MFFFIDTSIEYNTLEKTLHDLDCFRQRPRPFAACGKYVVTFSEIIEQWQNDLYEYFHLSIPFADPQKDVVE